MKARKIALLASFVAGAAFAEAPAVPARDPGYDALGHLVGRWTEKGNEATFVETCEWFHGRYHVVCRAERKRPDGTTSHGMSILSFVPGEGYVYTGIGSKGRYETLQHGTVENDILEFRSSAVQDGKTTVTRIRIGPFAEKAMPFVVDTSTDGGPWSAPDVTDYVRLD